MKNFKYLFIFFISFLSAGLLWSVISFFLPKYPNVYIPPKFNSEFYNINLEKIFTAENQNIKTVRKQTAQKPELSIKDIKLKAIYNDGKTAFIIIEDKGKSIFLDLYKKYRNYKLVKIYNSYVVFEKNSKEYTLSFEDKKTANLQKIKTYTKKTAKTENISKKTINQYKNDFSKIWNEIGIVKVSKGYRITYVKKGGIFDRLGLKRGDIIIKVNGKNITNDAQAWNLYKNIDKMEYLEIEIKRNNKTKVISYEIN